MVRMYNERALKLEVRELLEGRSDWILQSECVFMSAPASFHGQAQMVQQLLECHGADPMVTISSLIKRMDKALEPVSNELLDLAISAKPWTVYDVAKDKETRNAFRRAMARMPDAWKWTDLARVPSALTPDMETGPKKQSQAKFKSKSANKDEAVQGLETVVLLSESSVEFSCPTVQERMAADREKRAQAAEA
ncbi:hypothetical protein BGW39_008051 [Mortierella sp. 14UC]|nr:hypothetical protein BGW39_008051 [Mortierella sp. 14UC]